MFKKIAIGLLAITVLGAGGAAAAYSASTKEAEPVQEVVAQEQGHGNEVTGQQGHQEEAQQGKGQQSEAQGNQDMMAEGSLIV